MNDHVNGKGRDIMAQLQRPLHSDVRVEEGFWHDQLHKIHTITVQDVLAKFERDGGEGVMKNYERVAARERGAHVGPPWYDGLICETIRGISDIIAHTYDAQLDAALDGYATRIAAAQAVDPDGYVNTYGTLVCPNNRWGEQGGNIVWQHELYNLGCLVEAGVHHFLATGKTQLLGCAVRAANCMAKVMGPAPRKNIVPAHSLPEEAVVKLACLLRDRAGLADSLREQEGVEADGPAYLALAVFWMDHRGVHDSRASYPHYMGEYAQDHAPVTQQAEAVGHAVRAALLYTGLASVGIEAGRKDFLEAAQRIWHNVVTTKLHISGGIGAVHNEERFGYQYNLPNDAYLETCAGVALAFWAGEMHRAFGHASYMDVFERALYNNVLPGLSADGTHYFYENPLVSDGNIERWAWHSCPCCPPMFLKLMGSLPDFIYSFTADRLCVNLHIGSRFAGNVGGQAIALYQENCGLPWSGENTLRLSLGSPATFALAVRLPEWAGKVTFRINGTETTYQTEDGYAVFARTWQDGDSVELSMELPAMRMKAHPYVRASEGRVALQRGPLLYCVEAMDNGGTVDLTLGDGPLCTEEADLMGRAVLLHGPLADGGTFTAVPYYLWNNRGKGEMAVWLCQKGLGEGKSSLAYIENGAYKGLPSGTVASLEGWEGKLYRPL